MASLLIVSKFLIHSGFFSVSLIFTCVIILKQLFAVGSVNIGEYLPQLRELRLGKYSPIFTEPTANNFC
jgi:hypothetical protein